MNETKKINFEEAKAEIESGAEFWHETGMSDLDSGRGLGLRDALNILARVEQPQINKNYTKAMDHLKYLREFPKPSYERRTEDGYPLEICYDEYAYKRMCDTYRDAIKQVLVLLGEIEEEEEK